MKIELRIEGGTADYTPIADDAAGQIISGYKPSLRAAPQTDALAVSPDQPFATFISGRSGEWTLDFSVDRQHASADAALAFLNEHLALFAEAAQFHLKITVGAQIVYLAFCAPTSLEPEPHSDQHTFLRYTFVGASYTENEPV